MPTTVRHYTDEAGREAPPETAVLCVEQVLSDEGVLLSEAFYHRSGV